MPIAIYLLLLGGQRDGLAPVQAVSIKHKLNALSQQQGIFDRALRKIEKEESEKAEAREYLIA